MSHTLRFCKGCKKFIWDLRLKGFEPLEGMILWFVLRNGPYALPGNYKIQLITPADTLTQDLELVLDPRVSTGMPELKAQQEFMLRIRDGLDSTNLCTLFWNFYTNQLPKSEK